MRQYYKAYYLKDLRQFNDWSEMHVDNDAELLDDTVCYLGDDFVVVLNPVQDKEPLFKNVTSTWQAFCVTTLKFEVPEDLRTDNAQGTSVAEAATV